MKWTPFTGALAGGLVVIVFLGVTGNMQGCTVVDRTLNEQARQWWQSEEEYLDEIAEDCVLTTYGPEGEPLDLPERVARRMIDRCIEADIRHAFENGYLSRDDDR